MSFSGTKGWNTKPKPGVMLNPLHPLSRGLVGYWLFNEGSGSQAYDISGKGNHGTLKGMSPNAQGSGWSGSKLGGGLQFDGADDYVSVPNFSSNITNSDITMCGWVKSPNNPIMHAPYFGIRDDSIANFYVTQLAGTNTLECRFTNSGGTTFDASPAPPIAPNVWNFIVFTYDGSNVRCYVNAIEEGSAGANGVITDNSEGLEIGGIVRPTDDFFLNAPISFAIIYNRALSAIEAKQLYHDPFCNLLQVPIRRYYVAAPPGVTVPVFMHHYNQLARA